MAKRRKGSEWRCWACEYFQTVAMAELIRERAEKEGIDLEAAKKHAAEYQQGSNAFTVTAGFGSTITTDGTDIRSIMITGDENGA